ncbi:hypothetical protein CROQUDRAFT_216589 [Cronartium quercuum f. sp. fusiforme G11]|uniref:Rpr2-domain-containing protein n=1 Tax=Cronartium quercuum f. sp. fusiforme G11 TaxID=708437 RepID=A0A9P6T8A8_9BASI|nr:hypothetical protein CROQUDRAFT_216589 [Cronartium quercuum f. sp. fusiforme G11]
MVKKTTNSTPNPNSVPNKDVLQRLNFLHQASHYLATFTTPNTIPKNQIKTEIIKSLNHAPMSGISRILSNTIKPIAKKAVVRMYVFSYPFGSLSVFLLISFINRDPSVKRSFCKSCSIILIPGQTSKTKIHKSKIHHHSISITCLSCNHKRCIPYQPEANQLNSEFKQKPFWSRDSHITFIESNSNQKKN